jgi:hypothetical protein
LIPWFWLLEVWLIVCEESADVPPDADGLRVFGGQSVFKRCATGCSGNNFEQSDPFSRMVRLVPTDSPPPPCGRSAQASEDCLSPLCKTKDFIENPNPCTLAIVLGSVAIAYRTSHR